MLRAPVVVGLVFFHTAVVFGAGEFPVKAAAENRVAAVLLAFGATWGMPLLFLVSGMGAWPSLRSRSPGGFARERLRRLGVPLLVGLLTLVPLQAGHLWFLVCLLGFSLLLLPGFAWLGRPAGARLLVPLGGLLARPGGLLLPALPIAAVELALGGEVGHGAWNRFSYALFLLAGYLAAADPRVAAAFQRRWRVAAALGLALFVAAGSAYAAAAAGADPFTAMDPTSLAFRLLKSADGWLWVVAILGSPAPASPADPRHPPRPPAGTPRHPPRQGGAAWPPTPTRPSCRSTCCTSR